MSKEVSFTCDCGCGSITLRPEDFGWLVLSQMGQPEDWYIPKLKRELHFKTLTCLQTWTARAVAVVPELQESACKISPRGGIYSDKCPEIST